MKCSAIIERDTVKRQKKILSLIQKTKGQALILVPEKHLLEGYEGTGTIFHAGLKQSEKKRIWSHVASGETQIVIGTQKALFLPYKNLTTIVVDEEQYESYKLWDQYPRLHTLRGAEQLASISGADLVYASSYPSIRLRHAIQGGVCKQLLNHPISLSVKSIPFSFEDRKWKRAVPDEVSSVIRTWARKGRNVLVLYNKKDAAIVRDAITRRLGKKAIQHIYIGTIGLLTDHTLPTIDAVAWLFPEFTMRAYDFRSSERARILAARLQTITPTSPIIVATRHLALAQEVFESSEEVWYTKVLEERSRLTLPPFSDLVRLTIRDKSDNKAKERAAKVREMLGESFKEIPSCRVLGPFQEYRAKTKKTHEYHLLLSGPLEMLVEAYKDVPVDSADVDPHRIV